MSNNGNPNPFARCLHCQGPIWNGNPAKAHKDGWIHWFSITCDQVREDRALAAEKDMMDGPKQ